MLTTCAAPLRLQDLSSSNIKLTWAATTTYDLDAKLKDGWKFEKSVKLTMSVPVIDLGSATGGKVGGGL